MMAMVTSKDLIDPIVLVLWTMISAHRYKRWRGPSCWFCYDFADVRMSGFQWKNREDRPVQWMKRSLLDEFLAT